MTSEHQDNTAASAAAEAVRRGYQPVPIRDRDKRPHGSSWTQLRWDSLEQAEASFLRWAEDGAGGVGLILGEPSRGLLDIDLDHPKAVRLRDYFLPPTAMVGGRTSRPRSHYWYIVDNLEHLPGTRRYKMPDGNVSVELRSTGSQTVIAPSIHPSGEPYRWYGQPWGGDEGPAVVDGRKLALQVALLGMGAVLLDNWPRQGSRHDAYLALAGGLLRFGEGVHPFWKMNASVLIRALADATNDEDGAEAREREVMGTTLSRLNAGGSAVGFPRLAEILGTDHAEMTRRMAREVESLAGFVSEPERIAAVEHPEDSPSTASPSVPDSLISTLPPEQRNPLEERESTWEAVDLEPYLANEIVVPEPSVLLREDGKGVFYPGRVNSLYGKSESGKTWCAYGAVAQEVERGERVVILDFEDEPAGTLLRLRSLGLGDDDIKNQVRYVHPEGPLADMQRYKFGDRPTDLGRDNSAAFRSLLERFDPTLIVADGMTALYGLHGHDTNDAGGTDVVTTWLKALCRGGRTTVVVIDHTGKAGGAGSSPIGAHHKIAMVQGTALRVDPVKRPVPGDIGTLRLVVYKDRLGEVRKISTKSSEEPVAAKVVIDSRKEGFTRLTLEVPDEKEIVLGDGDVMARKLEKLSHAAEAEQSIIDFFEGDADREVTTKEVCEELDLDAEVVRAAWAALTARGDVQRLGSTRYTRYRLQA